MMELKSIKELLVDNRVESIKLCKYVIDSRHIKCFIDLIFNGQQRQDDITEEIYEGFQVMEKKEEVTGGYTYTKVIK